MIEHLEYTYLIASGEIQDFDVVTPEKILEKVQETLYNFDPMPQNYEFPLSKRLKKLKHDSLEVAKIKLMEAREEYLDFFKEYPDAKTKNVVFGPLDKFEWYLLERKHLNHHFKQFDLL